MNMPTLQELSEASGLPPGLVKFSLCLVSLLPLSLGYKVFPGGRLRELYSILSGGILCSVAYGYFGIENLFVTPAVTYILLLVMPRKYCALAVSAFAFAHLIMCHVLNASGAAWTEGNIDFTGSQMVLVLKCVGVAFNYQDGLIPAQDMTRHQSNTHLKDLPSPLSFLAYIADPTTALIGPFIEYRQYSDFVNKKDVYAPSSAQSSFVLFLTSFLDSFVRTVVFGAIYTYLSGHYPVSILTSQDYLQAPLLKQLAVTYAILVAARFKYYFCWTLSYACLKLSGQAWAGPEGGWSRGLNVRPFRVELATSATDYPTHWNICTGNWLRHYVYARQQGPKQTPGFRALIVTQGVSGIWHGLYPGYWLFFLSSAFMLQGSKWIYKMTVGVPGWAQPVTQVVHGLLSAIQLNYLALAFLLLEWQLTFQVWRELYFAGHIVSAVLIALSMMIKPPKRSKTA